jgi:CrcB protein
VTILWVALGGAVGAPLRYLTDRMVQARHDSLFPWGTWSVNVAGSLLLGFLAAGLIAGKVPPGVMAGLGTGLCGALTTYSTFGYETVRLIEDGAGLYATANVAASVIAALGAALFGALLATALWQ